MWQYVFACVFTKQMQWSLLPEYCTQNVAEASHTLLILKQLNPAIFTDKTLQWVLTYLNAINESLQWPASFQRSRSWGSFHNRLLPDAKIAIVLMLSIGWELITMRYHTPNTNQNRHSLCVSWCEHCGTVVKNAFCNMKIIASWNASSMVTARNMAISKQHKPNVLFRCWTLKIRNKPYEFMLRALSWVTAYSNFMIEVWCPHALLKHRPLLNNHLSICRSKSSSQSFHSQSQSYSHPHGSKGGIMLLISTASLLQKRSFHHFYACNGPNI